jgi:predicted small secreted protein
MKVIFILTLSMLTLSACANTWHGAGQDIERMGEKMQGRR